MGYTIIHSAEEGVRHLETHPPMGDSFELAVSDSFTFVGHADTMGAGMAILLDKIFDLEYEPDGFEQMDGFKIYRYRKSGHREYTEAERGETRFRFLDLSATPVSCGPADEETTGIPLGWVFLWTLVIVLIGLLLWIIL